MRREHGIGTYGDTRRRGKEGIKGGRKRE